MKFSWEHTFENCKEFVCKQTKGDRVPVRTTTAGLQYTGAFGGSSFPEIYTARVFLIAALSAPMEVLKHVK